MAQRSKLTRTRRLRGLLRILSLVVLSLFCSQMALAYALPFVAPEDCGQEECPNEGDEPLCPCPFNCVSRCAGRAMPALPPALPSVELSAIVSVELLPLSIERAPPAADPNEILHVPKPLRA